MTAEPAPRRGRAPRADDPGSALIERLSALPNLGRTAEDRIELAKL